MTTDTLALEKCIASDRPVHPPVPSPGILENPEPDEILGYPPRTQLLLDGFDADEITADFLIGVHDLAEEQGLSLEAISVRRDRTLD